MQDAAPYAAITIRVVGAVSSLTAVYGLAILFFASRKLLGVHQPRVKFLSIQLLILQTNLVPHLLSALANTPGLLPRQGIYTPHVRALAIGNAISCVAMLLLALLHRKAYPLWLIPGLPRQQPPQQQHRRPLRRLCCRPCCGDLLSNALSCGSCFRGQREKPLRELAAAAEFVRSLATEQQLSPPCGGRLLSVHRVDDSDSADTYRMLPGQQQEVV